MVSDWNMQPTTGPELLQQVRADARLRSAPFIMVAAEREVENIVAAEQAGGSNDVVEPFSAETLRAKIDTVFAGA